MAYPPCRRNLAKANMLQGCKERTTHQSNKSVSCSCLPTLNIAVIKWFVVDSSTNVKRFTCLTRRPVSGEVGALTVYFKRFGHCTVSGVVALVTTLHSVEVKADDTENMIEYQDFTMLSIFFVSSFPHDEYNSDLR